MNLVTAICLAVTRFFFGWITGGPYEETKASGVKREDQGIRKRTFYLQAGVGGTAGARRKLS
jgi:hypothetical protein